MKEQSPCLSVRVEHLVWCKKRLVSYALPHGCDQCRATAYLFANLYQSSGGE